MAAKQHNIPIKQRLTVVLMYMYSRRNYETSLMDLVNEFGYSRQTYKRDFKDLEELFCNKIKFKDGRKNGTGYRLLIRGDKEFKENFKNYMKYAYLTQTQMF